MKRTKSEDQESQCHKFAAIFHYISNDVRLSLTGIITEILLGKKNTNILLIENINHIAFLPTVLAIKIIVRILFMQYNLESWLL